MTTAHYERGAISPEKAFVSESHCNGTVYEIDGPEDSPVIVLIHGLGLNRHVWRQHLPALCTRYQVVTYDLFGHGGSTPPPSAPSLSMWSDQLLKLLDDLAIGRCAVAGFSLGGMINRRFAMDHPERLSALAIFNSPHERGEEAQRLVEKRATDSAAGGPAATLNATIERWFTPEFRDGASDVIAEVRRWVLANDPEVYAACRLVLAEGVIELIRPDPPITLPTLVMTAENDSGSTPAMSQAIASEIPGAETIIVPHLQHMALVEAPSRFTGPLMRFLDDVPE